MSKRKKSRKSMEDDIPDDRGELQRVVLMIARTQPGFKESSFQQPQTKKKTFLKWIYGQTFGETDSREISRKKGRVKSLQHLIKALHYGKWSKPEDTKARKIKKKS